MNMRKYLFVAALFFIIGVLSSCTFVAKDIKLVDAKIVTGIDERLMPVNVTDTFPKGTSRVSCWIQWQDAKINSQLLAKWHYITDDIHVLDYIFNIPKKDGTGSVALSMPSGKTLPSGRYKVDLVSGGRVLKSLNFKVE